jgi:hypothetical protein
MSTEPRAKSDRLYATHCEALTLSGRTAGRYRSRFCNRRRFHVCAIIKASSGEFFWRSRFAAPGQTSDLVPVQGSFQNPFVPQHRDP